MKNSTPAVIVAIASLFSGLVRAQDPPSSALMPTKTFRQRVVVSGLAGPWEITWGPDNVLWVTERTGKRVTRIDPATGEQQAAITIDEVSAPGGQDGLLGMALDPGLLKGTGNDYVYVAYTYVDKVKGPDLSVPDPNNPYRFLYGKIVRLTYHPVTGALSDPVDLITGLPAGNDHVSGRLKFGPDRKLYFTIGDQGHNQLGNYCLPTEAQRLPTQQEVDNKDYIAYVGKSIRLNLDGSIPEDNPKLNGVVSHVYTYGHRNMQGIDFAPDGTLYASEQGPKTDDEVNILKSGGNYGWPHVAGFKDDKAYEYARWAEASTPCTQIKFSDITIDPSVPREAESAFTKPLIEPLATLFTVPTGYNFQDPVCRGVDYICWPTVGASSIEYYKAGAIPGWGKVLFVTALKRGSLYVVPLSDDGQSKKGLISRYFQSENRYRDLAVSPDGQTIYIATDPGGMADALAGGTTRRMQNRGAILAFTYDHEGAPPPPAPAPAAPQVTEAAPAPAPAPARSGTPPPFTAAQAVAGKTAYDANCAVCHGNTMTNGTFAPPLAGEYFKEHWSGRGARGFFDKMKSMPPAAPGSLPDNSYAAILGYIMQMNGVKPGDTPTPTNAGAMDTLTLP